MSENQLIHHIGFCVINFFYKKGTSRLYSAMRKYGLENFEFNIVLNIIEKFDKKIINEHMNYYERELINELNRTDKNFGYNMTLGGDGGRNEQAIIAANLRKGKTYEELYGEEKAQIRKNKMRNANLNRIYTKLSEETKHDISKKIKEKWQDEIYSNKVVSNNRMKGKIGIQHHYFGKKHTEEAKIKMKENKKEFKHTEEHRQYLSKINKKENNPNYADIDTEKLLFEMINDSNFNVKSLASKFGVSYPTMSARIRYILKIDNIQKYRRLNDISELAKGVYENVVC